MDAKLCFFVLIGVLAVYSKADTTSEDAPLDQLIANLFKGYNKVSIPDVGLNVSHSISLVRIVGLEDQVLTLSTFIEMGWKDRRLTWSPDNYGGIKTVRVPASMIWQPDILLFNSAQQFDGFPGQELAAIVGNDGSIIFVPPVITKSYCEVKAKFMKRHHKVSCDLKFGSWVYSRDMMDIFPKSDSMGLSVFYPNSVWKYGSSSVVRKIDKYDCCPEEYVSLTYSVTMKYMDTDE